MELQSIIKQSIEGNRQAMKVLYTTYADDMYSSSLRITNDRQASEDILQESFVKSILNLDKLKQKDNYQGWYRRIIINASLGYIKKRISFDDINEENYTDQEEDQKWYHDIPMSAIREAIQQLPTRSRTIFSLYAVENYKHNEISNELGISVSTSKTQYRYAKKLLKAHLTKTYAQ